MLHDLIQTIVSTVGAWGYLGIFLMMALESSFFPFPSEVVMIPAGYLAYKGEMNIVLAILAGIGGSLFGALFNYWLALKLGRRFLLRYGRYVLVKEHTLQRMEDFFARHGHISTFTGRLIPAVRQYISLPAGLARMNLAVFSFYTSLGAGIWVTILAVLGYSLGHNEAAIRANLHLITLITLGAVAVIVLLYIRLKLKKKVLR
ncbi:putative integral membrane protein dedA-like protein [Thiobacillus denitrificans ATCC 25259]|uniref:Putative integral membrane protein dedA-like protein n=1 Tax=Thiobacillus denitrificans (strain ATCC 25259 / T1) TaxID=292415 RepID=Q3SH55_THIDA|nr:DedA family protein [Thiobacillus denitrificans]AAZ98034.1 putative integral membrane protein dedA-like protein [Thiobacillus denitrificans ATCC 25259]